MMCSCKMFVFNGNFPETLVSLFCIDRNILNKGLVSPCDLWSTVLLVRVPSSCIICVYVDRASWTSCSSSYLNAGDRLFESRPGHKLFSLRFEAFLISCRERLDNTLKATTTFSSSPPSNHHSPSFHHSALYCLGLLTAALNGSFFLLQPPST